MGATLTAEFIALVGRIDRFDSADALAAAAGLAPVLRQSGKTSFLRRAAGGDKASSASSIRQPSPLSDDPTAAPSTTASVPRANATTRPSSPSQEDA
ncbi:MAG: transposase [Rhodobacteraceae bacterium]|nr:transposase [Paracoccaceae bacterium]